MFNKLNQDGLEQQKDVLGGGRQLFDTDIYDAEIKMAYGDFSKKGAMFVALELEIDGKRYSENVYVSNRDGENFYVRDNKKNPLPGFSIINDLCLVTEGVPLAEAETVEKKIKVYDYESKSEILRTMPVLVNLIGATASFGIQQFRKNKQELNSSSNKYENVNEENTGNEIKKVWHTETKSTVVEAESGQDPLFWDAWKTANEGKIYDTYKEVTAQGRTRPGKASKGDAEGDAPSGRSSLFNKKK